MTNVRDPEGERFITYAVWTFYVIRLVSFVAAMVWSMFFLSPR